MKMDRVQSNFTKILRSTVLLILGMALGTYIYVMVIENYKHKNVYPHIQGLDDATLKRLGVNQYHVDPDQVHDVQFPYRNFNRFCMGWIGIVEEYEWSYKHLKREHPYTQGYEPLKPGPDSITPTSVSKSKVYLQDKKSTFRRGEFIHVIVETRDDYGNQRLRGGDFLTGVMFNREMQASTAARMIDYGNGTYSMYFYAGWKGQATIDVSLSFTREAISFFDLTRFRDRRTLWSANFTDGKVIEKSNCTSTNEGTWENKCSYINPWSLGKTAVLCHKPKSLQCSTLTNISQNLHQMVTMAEQDVKDMRYLFERKYRKAIFSASPIKVVIKDSKSQLDLPTCGPDLPIPMSSGYWKSYNIFVPLVCRSQDWTPEQRFKCASDKLFFSVGDSTLGQFSQVFRDEFIMGGDVTIDHHYIALRGGWPVQNVHEIMFESDFIDKINSSVCRSHTPVVLFNFCFHYGLWSIRAYLDRVYQTKLSVLRLFQRCPGAIVIAKLAHPRNNIDVPQSVHSGNYLYYDMNRMLRRVFGGSGVHFLDVWDMVVAHPDDNDVHVGRHIIIQQMDMMFSHVCPDMVKGS